MRLQDWPVRLDRFTRAAANRPFKWGSHDCVLAAAGCYEALTGLDVSAEYRGKYSTPEGAARILKKSFGGGVKEAASRFLGEPMDNPLMAQRGDICLLGTELGDALGWCIGPNVAAAGPNGLSLVPLRSVKMAWRV